MNRIQAVAAAMTNEEESAHMLSIEDSMHVINSMPSNVFTQRIDRISAYSIPFQ